MADELVCDYYHISDFDGDALRDFNKKNETMMEGVIYLVPNLETAKKLLDDSKVSSDDSKISHSISIIIGDNDERSLKEFKDSLKRIKERKVDFLGKSCFVIHSLFDDKSKEKIDQALKDVDKSSLLCDDSKTNDTLSKNNVDKMHVSNNLDRWLEEMEIEYKATINTGFPKLDKALGGGLRSKRLYGIGGITSIGKTTFVMNIADNVAKSKQNVLIFSLEMSKYELIDKSITKQIALEYINKEKDQTGKNMLPSLPTTIDPKLSKKAKESYKKLGEYLYIYEGSGDVNVDVIKKVFDSIDREIHEIPKLVIVDYLQIMASHNNKFNLSEKQIVDKNITELKRICRDRDVAIIVVSSFNRDAYDKEEVSPKSFKESGGIEYSCDVLMGLKLNCGKDEYENEMKKNPRDVKLIILKNRWGEMGEEVPFKYHPEYHYFIEPEKNDWTADSTECSSQKTRIITSL